MDENVNHGQYQIRLRKGSWELEISAPEKDFVLSEWKRLAETSLVMEEAFSGNGVEKETAINSMNADGRVDIPRNTKPQTLVEFIRQFKFQNNLEKTLVLGYWLEIRLQQTGFTREDISVKYKEAKETVPKNIGRDLGSLVSKGFLLQGGHSPDTYELTNTGIREIEQMLAGQG